MALELQVLFGENVPLASTSPPHNLCCHRVTRQLSTTPASRKGAGLLMCVCVPGTKCGQGWKQGHNKAPEVKEEDGGAEHTLSHR